MAQDKDYAITVSVKKYPSEAIAYLQYKGSNGEVKDSVAIGNGIFTFKGKIDEPRPASIVLKEPGKKPGSQHVIRFYIEPGNIGLSSKLMLSTADITGSVNSLERKEMDKLLAGDNFAQPDRVAVTQTTRVVAVPAGSMPPSGVMQGRPRSMPGTVVSKRTITDINELPYEMQSAIRALRDEAKGKVVQFIKDHPNSYVSMYTLHSLWSAKRITYLEYMSLWNGFSPSLMQSNEGKMMLTL